MELNQTRQAMLKQLPGIDRILELSKNDPDLSLLSKSIVTRGARRVVDRLRAAILHGDETVSSIALTDEAIIESVRSAVSADMSPNLKHVVNATGIVIHTNLGRSLLAPEAVAHMAVIASGYSNLEFNLDTGKRGLRYDCIEELICEITGAQAAMVVNNNAGAVLLCLETMASGRQVIVSRGELVEIGGSFRIPDVMTKSGAILKEVGTTNRTHMKDYESAIDQDTGLLLKVHTSNYTIQGFTAEVPLRDLVQLGHSRHIPVMEDLGSGMFMDFSRYGLPREPTVQESVATGADIVTFSGDKLLGGPQAGIIAGKKEIIREIGKNPLTRALRIDKLTLAALESTLRLHRDPERALREIPTLRMLTLPMDTLKGKAETLAQLLEQIDDPRLQIQRLDRPSRVGGGSLPLVELPSKCLGITIEHISAGFIAEFMRRYSSPVIGRIEENVFVMDLRTVQDNEFPIVKTAFSTLLAKGISC
ncbi:MAG: L-seryl-tRNA(Sec) selenium transferase [Desulfobacterales bacterium]|nr:L-seryl-tRNA(Sec) selenium transferase [Desulfobacterales bacterium]